MKWRVKFLDDEVMATLGTFPKDIRGSFERIVTLIQAHGIERMREPYVKHLEGPVWEMRMKAAMASPGRLMSRRQAGAWSWSMSLPRRRRKPRAGKSTLP